MRRRSRRTTPSTSASRLGSPLSWRLGISDQRGAAAVEFTIVAALFVIPLVFGLVEFGSMLFSKQIIINASREGTRAGIIGYGDSGRLTDTEITDIVKGYVESKQQGAMLRTFRNQPEPVIVITPSPRGCGSGVSRGADLKVEITYTHSYLLPDLIGLGTSKALIASTTMKMESDDCLPAP
ncbi:TadE family protein [Candidatus Moduliflexota bacterium]